MNLLIGLQTLFQRWQLSFNKYKIVGALIGMIALFIFDKKKKYRSSYKPIKKFFLKNILYNVTSHKQEHRSAKSILYTPFANKIYLEHYLLNTFELFLLHPLLLEHERSHLQYFQLYSLEQQDPRDHKIAYMH